MAKVPGASSPSASSSRQPSTQDGPGYGPGTAMKRGRVSLSRELPASARPARGCSRVFSFRLPCGAHRRIRADLALPPHQRLWHRGASLPPRRSQGATPPASRYGLLFASMGLYGVVRMMRRGWAMPRRGRAAVTAGEGRLVGRLDRSPASTSSDAPSLSVSFP